MKQGAVESPIIFARLLDEIMSEVRVENADMHEGMESTGACFMDDVLAWMCLVPTMLDLMLPKLRYFGLHVRPTKCKLLCLQGPRNLPVKLAGELFYPLPEGESITVMNLPIDV